MKISFYAFIIPFSFCNRAKQKIPKIKMLADLLKSEADRIICRSCFHEDGGEHAILEAVEVDSQVRYNTSHI